MLIKLTPIIENIPISFATFLTWVPFSWRLGHIYKKSQVEIVNFNRMNELEKRAYIFGRVKRIVDTAYNTNKFYHDFYNQHNFSPKMLQCYDDLKLIPIVTKADLKSYPLEKRSTLKHGCYLANTGGTSGEPLEFYLAAESPGREWAHMHHIWSKLSYVQNKLKLTFRGMNFGKKALKYNPIQNEFKVNAYIDIATISEAIKEIATKYPINYLHGYPSAIYRFADFLEKNDQETLFILCKSLKGIFLGSEYPAPVYREVIESTFRVPSISWYGHSERALLAYEEKEKYVYVPFHTYGYCEAVKDESGSYRLIGTSYDNTVSPFIRYDTGDLIEPIDEENPLQSFRITLGRIGEFIYDENNQAISLTALIFGRHHQIFRKAKFLQVWQPCPGKAIILVTFTNEGDSSEIIWEKEFDTTGIRMDFEFSVLNEPVFTSSGKVPLLIKNSPNSVT
jgi:phenylacetate-CoA ligase